MELTEHSHKEYEAIFGKPYHIFNTSAFNHLNEGKCGMVKYLSFKDRKYRLGFIGGVKGEIFSSPFSAPFGGFSFIHSDVSIAHIEEAILLLDQYLQKMGLAGVKMILPPLFYHDTFLSKLMNVLYRSGYENTNLDLDYYIDLSQFDNYLQQLWYNAKKNLLQSLNKELKFAKCTVYSFGDVYNIISSNRAFRGFPMTMQLADIVNTATVIPTDLFMVKHGSVGIASAIAYHVNDTTIYIPYWGDKNGYNDMKPMNFLAFKIFEYYKQLGKRIVHIGIATENSVPNYGLCEFKESIGCKVTPKFTYLKKY